MRSLTKSYWLPFMLIVVLAYGVVPVDAQSSEPEPPDKVLYLPAVNGPDLSPNDTIQVIDWNEWISYGVERGGYSFRYPSSYVITFPNSAPPWVVQLRPASDSVTEATITLSYLTPGIEEGRDLSEWARTYHAIGPAAYEDLGFFPFDLAHANLPEGSQQIYVASKEGVPHPFHAYYILHNPW